jgi:phage terminase large subunit-like protein
MLPDGGRVEQGTCTRFQTVDVAISSKETSDYTVISTWALTPNRDLLLLDCQRRQYEEQDIVGFMQRVSDQHGRPPMWVERFGAGRSPLAILSRAGYPVMELPVEAGTKLDKNTRAFGAIALYQQHKILHPAGQPPAGAQAGRRGGWRAMGGLPHVPPHVRVDPVRVGA